MTLFYYEPIFQEHRTGALPECGSRLAEVVRYLQFTGLVACCRRPAWQPITPERLARVHSPAYTEDLRLFCAAGGGWIESDTFVNLRSYEVATHAAGAVCDAVQRVVAGEVQRAFCLVRPPGHHALENGAMGFCLLNNVAFGARLATDELGLDRVLIVDWDVHHGNGTQQTFWEDGRIGFLSIHRWPFYPGTGSADEVGEGAGLGMTLNMPVEFGTPRNEYVKTFASGLASFAAHVRPQLILVSAGFDAHRADPVGSLGLETVDFVELTRLVLDVADQFAGGRLVSVLEGGYDPAALADCVEVHLEELLARDP